MELVLVYKLFYPKCALCEEPLPLVDGHPYRHICQVCLSGLELEQPACFRCGIALTEKEHSGAPTTGTHSNLLNCGDCLASQPMQYRSVCAFSYRFPMTELISQLKFHSRFHLTPLLVELFSHACRQAYTGDSLPEALIAVPLHANRAFKRGFNQAELIAYYLARDLDIALLQGVVYKRKSTTSQMSLSTQERQKNLSNAFELSDIKRLEGLQHIALFDDVITTGATMHNLAKAVAQSGIQRIDYWSLARTPKHFK